MRGLFEGLVEGLDVVGGLGLEEAGAEGVPAIGVVDDADDGGEVVHVAVELPGGDPDADDRVFG